MYTFRALHMSTPQAAQGLETPPRTSTSHLASDPKCRPPSAQPRTQLSMATCPGQRTMEATRGNGYTPAWGSLVMMMMKCTCVSYTNNCRLSILSLTVNCDVAVSVIIIMTYDCNMQQWHIITHYNQCTWLPVSWLQAGEGQQASSADQEFHQSPKQLHIQKIQPLIRITECKSSTDRLLSVRLHSYWYEYEYECGYPCAGYSKHEFACIPTVVIRIKTSTA